MRFAAILVSLSFLMLSSLASAQSAPTFNLMPQPSSITSGSGALRIDASFAIAFTGHDEPRLKRAGERFLTQLHRQTGLVLGKQTRDAAKATLAVHTDRLCCGTRIAVQTGLAGKVRGANPWTAPPVQSSLIAGGSPR